jgi:hypothetical protein
MSRREQKSWSWISRRLRTGLTVLVKANSNLTDDRVDGWSNELVVRQSSAGKKMSTETENIVEIRHQATTGENIAVVAAISGVRNSVRLS